MDRPLTGGCSCGRNRYTIQLPLTNTADPQVCRVFFDSSQSHRKSQASSPLSAWLRVPLTWYSSTTYAYFDDETHNSIRKVYETTAENGNGEGEGEGGTKRGFCGFCGTMLSFWTESPPSHADYISLTLGTLSSSDLRDLEELGLLPPEAVSDAESDREKLEKAIDDKEAKEGVPWFESLVEGSRLSRMRKSRGAQKTGRWNVEWEVVEWTDDGVEVTPAAPGGKRKLEETIGEEDVEMKGH